jgi:hypothetical protein
LQDDNTVNPSGVAHSNVHHAEFFEPNIRKELQEKGGGGGWKGTTSTVFGSTPTEGPATNDPWVWLTAYSRIPVSSNLFIRICLEVERGNEVFLSLRFGDGRDSARTPKNCLRSYP